MNNQLFPSMNSNPLAQMVNQTMQPPMQQPTMPTKQVNYPQVTTLTLPNGDQMSSINTPPPENFDTEAMQGSMQQILSENIGLYVHIDFLIGTSGIIRKSGYIHSVGRSVVVLYDDINNVYVMCDIFSVKFVVFFTPGQHTPGVPSPIVESPVQTAEIPPSPSTLTSTPTSAPPPQQSRNRRHG